MIAGRIARVGEAGKSGCYSLKIPPLRQGPAQGFRGDVAFEGGVLADEGFERQDLGGLQGFGAGVVAGAAELDGATARLGDVETAAADVDQRLERAMTVIGAVIARAEVEAGPGPVSVPGSEDGEEDEGEPAAASLAREH